MKKILFAAITLILFATAIFIIQSCQKVHGQGSPGNSTGLILYGKATYGIVNAGTDSSTNFYIPALYVCNVDGTDSRQIPINLPNGLIITLSTPGTSLCNGGKGVVFTTARVGMGGALVYGSIYSCNLDGSNLKEITQGAQLLDGY